MLKQNLLLILILTQFGQALALGSNQIYYDLYSFLIQFQDNTPALDPEIKVEDQLYIYDALDSCKLRCGINLQDSFRVYKFNYLCDGCEDFILIKFESSYHIFKENNLNAVLRKLLEIRNSRPDLLPENLFDNYLKMMAQSRPMDVVKQNGHLNYYYNLRDK